MQNEIETELELDFDLDIGFGGDLEFDEINTDLFSLGSDEDQFNTRYFKPQRPRQYKESHVTYKNADELAKATPIGKGERLFAVIDGTFILETTLKRWQFIIISTSKRCSCIRCQCQKIT